MTPRELAAAIRKGHTMIGEDRDVYLTSAGDCGCALGAALVAKGYTRSDCQVAGVITTDTIAAVLGTAPKFTFDVSLKHFQGMPRLEIADWLDTLDVSKPRDAQTFDDFMKATMVAVELEKPVRSEIDSLAK